MDQSMGRKVGRQEGTREIPGNLGGRNQLQPRKIRVQLIPRERERYLDIFRECSGNTQTGY